MRALWRHTYEVVRLLFVLAWALGFVWLVGPDEPPFSVLILLAGGLLMTAGVVAVSDDGRAIARLNQRHGLREEPPRHVFMGACMIVIGGGWLVLGLA